MCAALSSVYVAVMMCVGVFELVLLLFLSSGLVILCCVCTRYYYDCLFVVY